MPRLTSYGFQKSLAAQQTGEDGVTLITITPPSGPVLRLSSHALKRLSTNPLAYGVRSRGNNYYFVLMEASFPDDEEGVPPATQITCQMVDSGLADPLRNLGSGVLVVDIEMVKLTDPETVEFDEKGLEGAAANISSERIILTVSTDLFTSEPWPCDYMTKEKAPGQFP